MMTHDACRTCGFEHPEIDCPRWPARESSPASAVAFGGKVRIEAAAPVVDLTPEQADAFWNQVAEAELVAFEQRVRARRRVTEGARGGWVNAPAAGRHAVDAGMALAESTGVALDLLRGKLQEHRARSTCRHCGTAIEQLQHGWTDEAGWYACVKAPRGGAPVLHEPMPEPVAIARDWTPAAPEPGDPYPAPDYQHPDDDDDAR